MEKNRVSYVKRCLNERCASKERCEHGQAQMRFHQYFPEGIDDVPDYMLGTLRAIYPVHSKCTRWKMNREESIELQNKYANMT